MKIRDIIAEAKTAQAPKPRNFVAKNAKTGGAGAHKDKKKAQKQGDVKHKGKVMAEGFVNDTVQSLVDIRAVVKQIQTGNAQYPQGFASQLEVALYAAINALRDNPEKGAQNTVNELADLRAIAKQVQTGKATFPQGYASRLEWVLYDAIKQIENSSRGVAEGSLNEEEYDYYRDYKAGLISWEEYQELVARDQQREKEQRWAEQDRDRGPWYIKINGKIYKQKGVSKSFDWKSGAVKYGQAILKNNPSLKIVLTKKDQDDVSETATAGATSAGNVSVGAVYKNKPGKTAKNKDGTAKNALDIKANLLTGGSIKR